MAFYAKELIDSGAVTTSDGVLSSSRKWLVYADSPSTTLTSDRAVSLAGVERCDSHPIYFWLRAKDYTVTPKADRRYTWELSWSYEDFVCGDAPTTDFMEFSTAYRSIFIDTWRNEASLPSNIDNPSEEDISGTAIDSAGTPVSALLPQQELRVRQVKGETPDWGLYRSMSGTRNAAMWEGAPAGSVLYLGTAIRRIEEAKYELDHSFLWDYDYHLRQVVNRSPSDGNPKLGAPGGSYPDKGYEVFWKQPFPLTTDFGSLGLDGGLEPPGPTP